MLVQPHPPFAGPHRRPAHLVEPRGPAPGRVHQVRLAGTATAYTDDAVRRVVEGLHPVLPPGMPRPDPAQPELRCFPPDASASAADTAVPRAPAECRRPHSPSVATASS